MLPDQQVPPVAEPANAGARAAQYVKWNVWYARLRRPTQLAVIVLFSLLPWAQTQGWTKISGSLFALNIYGLPFADPLSALQALLLDGHFAVRLWIGAALVLLLAFVMGRVFCGWLCPYGLLSELVYALRRRLPLAVREDDAAKGYAFGCRITVFALGIVAAFALGFPVLHRLSLPGELSLAPLRAWEGWEIGLAILLPLGILLLAEGISGKRLWCRYVCPQSVSLSLAARCLPGGFGVKWTPAQCACKHNARPCQRACSLALMVRQKNGPPRTECMQCAQCVSACAKHGAALRMGL